MGFNLLYALEPVARLFPRVSRPKVPVTLGEKTAFTAIVLFAYLICCQIPLYGIIRNQSSDALYWTRVILASSRGTLMELGISPIISAGWILQFVGASGLLQADIKVTRDANIYQGVEKVLALIMAFGSVTGQLIYGSYGPIESLGICGSTAIVAQLMFSAFIVILLDDLLQSGYGLGSGISLFIVANTAENIFWKIFSPVTLSSEFGIQFEGSFLCLVHFLLTKSPKQALYLAFTRSSAPNLSSLLGTIVIFFLVIYLQGVKMTIPLIHQHSRGYTNNFRVRLFYTSSMSIILQSMFASKLYELSAILYAKFKGVALIGWLGTWENNKVVSGLAYWISPPSGLAQYASLRGLTYTVFVCALCAVFAQLWLVISKETPRQLTKRFRDQELTLANYRTQSVYEVLKRYVPTAAMLGGMTIGLLTILGDLLNVIGSSTGILLSVNIIYGYYERLMGSSNRATVTYY